MRPATTWFTVLVLAVLLAGCGADDDGPGRPVPPPGAGLSPQRELVSPTLQRTRAARGFVEPGGLVQEPGRRGRVLVLERRGTARWLDGAGPAAGPPFLDLRGRLSTKDEQGLLGLAFVGRGDDGDEQVVVHFNAPKGHNRVDRFVVRDDRVALSTGRTLLDVEQPYANHNGGEPVVGPDGRLYVGLGDGGSAYDPRQKAQDPASQLGKILSVDPRAARPRWRQVAIGLRNPWRLSFDARTGALWVADAGRDSAEAQTEEIDRIPASRLRPGRRPVNLGWSAYEGARDQANRALTPDTELLWPVASYTQRDGCNAVGGLALRGAAAARLPVLRDRYVFGDTCSGLVWSLPADAGLGAELRREGVRVPRQTAYLLDRRERLLVASLDGSLYRLRAAR
jgi:hypothetical protein